MGDDMNPGLRAYRQASLRVAVPDGLPEDMRDDIREIVAVHSDAPRKGHATALLHQVCAEADHDRKTLLIHVQPFDDGMSAEQLRKWYARFGFIEVQTNPCLMARSPEKPRISHG